MLQKLLRIGTSAAVTIPKKSLGELGLRFGDAVRVAVDTEARRVLIEPVARTARDDVRAWTRRFIGRYRPALKALAKK